jgi:hypothetical protein
VEDLPQRLPDFPGLDQLLVTELAHYERAQKIRKSNPLPLPLEFSDPEVNKIAVLSSWLCLGPDRIGRVSLGTTAFRAVAVRRCHGSLGLFKLCGIIRKKHSRSVAAPKTACQKVLKCFLGHANYFGAKR